MDVKTTRIGLAWLTLITLMTVGCHSSLLLKSTEPVSASRVDDGKTVVTVVFQGLVHLVHFGESSERALVLLPVVDLGAPGDMATTPHAARLLISQGCHTGRGWEEVRRCTGNGSRTETATGVDLRGRQISFPHTEGELNLVFDDAGGFHHLADLEPLVEYINDRRPVGNRLGSVIPAALDVNGWPRAGSLSSRVLLDGGTVGVTPEIWIRSGRHPIKFIRTDNQAVGHERSTLAASFVAELQLSELKIKVERVTAERTLELDRWLEIDPDCESVRLVIENAPSAGTPRSPDGSPCRVADYHFVGHYRLRENWRHHPDDGFLLVPEERRTSRGPELNNAQCSPAQSEESGG